MGKIPFRVNPMLATLVDKPFSKPNWVFEEKYDGVRMLAYKEGSKVSLISRNAIDRSARYPEIAATLGKLRIDTLLLDVPFRNGSVQTVVSPYSVRRKPHAPVSAPLAWSEVEQSLNPSDFNLGNFMKERSRKNPWADFFASGQNLKSAEDNLN